MDATMRLLCEYPVGTLRNATTVANKDVVATALKNMPGVGQPFLIFASLPALASAVDFSMYPQYVVSSDIGQNRAMIDEMLENPPIDAVTFAE